MTLPDLPVVALPTADDHVGFSPVPVGVPMLEERCGEFMDVSNFKEAGVPGVPLTSATSNVLRPVVCGEGEGGGLRFTEIEVDFPFCLGDGRAADSWKMWFRAIDEVTSWSRCS